MRLPLHVTTEDPRAPDFTRLLEEHLAFARGSTAAENAHALDLEALVAPAVSCYAARIDGELMAVGALQDLGGGHLEVKSMHTARGARRRGIGLELLEHLVNEARARGGTRLSLETGAMEAFAPARAMYHGAGFSACEPFGGYPPSPNTVFMTLAL